MNIIQGGFLGKLTKIHFFKLILNMGTDTSLLMAAGSLFQIFAALYMNPDLDIVSEQLTAMVFSCRCGKGWSASGVRSFSFSERYLGFSNLIALKSVIVVWNAAS